MRANSINSAANKPKRDWGFTLIELMIVITIIGILSAMILVGLQRVQSLGRDTRRIADLQQIRTGLELFFDHNRGYPNLSGTAGCWSNQTTGLAGALTGAGIGIARVPVDPLNRDAFVYCYSSASPWTSYVLRALLENNNNPALRDDMDGLIMGLECGPAVPPPGVPEGTSGVNSFFCVTL